MPHPGASQHTSSAFNRGAAPSYHQRPYHLHQQNPYNVAPPGHAPIHHPYIPSMSHLHPGQQPPPGPYSRSLDNGASPPSFNGGNPQHRRGMSASGAETYASSNPAIYPTPGCTCKKSKCTFCVIFLHVYFFGKILVLLLYFFSHFGCRFEIVLPMLCWIEIMQPFFVQVLRLCQSRLRAPGAHESSESNFGTQTERL